MRLPQLPLAPCELLHPQSHNGSDQVVDFTTFCTLILPLCRIRFTCAVCSSLPIASFRPCRYQQRPCDSDCLPPGQGDICFFQQTGGASHAGQTKGRAETLPSLLTFFVIFVVTCFYSTPPIISLYTANFLLFIISTREDRKGRWVPKAIYYHYRV